MPKTAGTIQGKNGGFDWYVVKGGASSPPHGRRGIQIDYGLSDEGKKKCKRIRFIQTVRTIRDGKPMKPASDEHRDWGYMDDDQAADGTVVDHEKCATDPYYPHGDTSHPDNEVEDTASMTDHPYVPNDVLPSGSSAIVYQFELCVVCESTGAVLDCVTWKYVRKADAFGHGKILPPSVAKTVTQSFTDAVAKFWANHQDKDGKPICPEKSKAAKTERSKAGGARTIRVLGSTDITVWETTIDPESVQGSARKLVADAAELAESASALRADAASLAPGRGAQRLLKAIADRADALDTTIARVRARAGRLAPARTIRRGRASDANRRDRSTNPRQILIEPLGRRPPQIPALVLHSYRRAFDPSLFQGDRRGELRSREPHRDAWTLSLQPDDIDALVTALVTATNRRPGRSDATPTLRVSVVGRPGTEPSVHEIPRANVPAVVNAIRTCIDPSNVFATEIAADWRRKFEL